MAEVLTYAKAGGPPSNWKDLDVFDGSEKIKGCLEINTVEGWAIVLDRNADGKIRLNERGDDALTKRIESNRFRIVPKAPSHG